MASRPGALGGRGLEEEVEMQTRAAEIGLLQMQAADAETLHLLIRFYSLAKTLCLSCRCHAADCVPADADDI
jgi:hypothetical protein